MLSRFNWLMEPFLLKAKLEFSCKMCGQLYAVTDGALLMQWLCADSWAIHLMGQWPTPLLSTMMCPSTPIISTA